MTSTEAATVVGSQTTTSPYTTDQHTVGDLPNIQIIRIYDQRFHLSNPSTMIIVGQRGDGVEFQSEAGEIQQIFASKQN